jgi:hypothetical protein
MHSPYSCGGVSVHLPVYRTGRLTFIILFFAPVLILAVDVCVRVCVWSGESVVLPEKVLRRLQLQDASYALSKPKAK